MCRTKFSLQFRVHDYRNQRYHKATVDFQQLSVSILEFPLLCVPLNYNRWLFVCLLRMKIGCLSNNFTLENNILNLMAATTISIFEYHPSLSFNNQAGNLLADQAG